MNCYINNQPGIPHTSYLHLFAFYLDSAILKRFAREKEVPSSVVYPFKIIRMIIKGWKDILFLSVLLNVYWIIWLHLYNFAVFYRHLLPSANSYLRYAIGFSVIYLAVLRLFLQSYPWLYKYVGLSLIHSESLTLGSTRILRCYPQAIREETDGGGWKYVRDVSPRYNGRWCLQSSLSTTRRLLLCVTPCWRAVHFSILPHSLPSAPLLRRPGGEFVSLTQTEARPLDHFNAFLCFRFAWCTVEKLTPPFTLSSFIPSAPVFPLLPV